MRYTHELFEQCVRRYVTKGGHGIKCRKGLWSVEGPELKAVELEAWHYWFQYRADGEYDEFLTTENNLTGNEN